MKTFIAVLFTLYCGLTAAAEPFRIGLSLGLSGRFSEMSDQQQKGLQLWERDVNARGGLLGRPVVLVIHDDLGEAATTAKLYERLIHEDRVDFLLGPYSSPLSTEAVKVATANGWPLLVTGGSADSLWEKGYKNIFGVYAPASQYQVGLFELIVESGISRIAVIHADDNFSTSAADSAKTLATRYGVNVVHWESFKKGMKDLTGPVSRARTAGAEVLIVNGHFDESVNARRALKSLAWTPRLYYATVGPALNKYGETLKQDAEGTFTSTLWEPRLRYPGSTAFDEAYRRTWGMTPSYHAALAYAGGQVLETAVARAKTLDRTALAATLFQMDTMTILGRYGVGRTGKQLRQQSFIIQWQKGKREIVHPEELATAKPVIR